MPSFETQRRVAFSATQMFDLVADVEAYPAFLPLCEALEVRERRQSPEGKPQLVAIMTCGYKAIHETFTSRVTLDREKREILVEYIDGPFRYLHNRWRFEPHDDGTSVVHFDIDYAFKSRMLGLLVGAMFDRAFRKFVTAFEARAGEIYEPPATSGQVQPAT